MLAEMPFQTNAEGEEISMAIALFPSTLGRRGDICEGGKTATLLMDMNKVCLHLSPKCKSSWAVIATNTRSQRRHASASPGTDVARFQAIFLSVLPTTAAVKGMGYVLPVPSSTPL